MSNLSPDNTLLPDLGPKTVNKLIENRLKNIFIDKKEVPVTWQDNEAGSKKEDLPGIFIEFIDIQRAEDRQFSDILEIDYNKLSDGSYAETIKVDYPQAYFITYDVHLYAETVDNIVDLVTEVTRRMPSQGFGFEIGEGECTFRLAVQRPNAPLNADVTEDNFFHRIYTFRVDTYIFDESSIRSVPNLDSDKPNGNIKIQFEVKDEN